MENLNRAKDKYEITSNNTFGRYLKAADDIKIGEIIFKDEALVIGPKPGSEIVCLNCYKQLLKKFSCCSKCKLAPLCGSACESVKGWHTESECATLSNLKSRLPVPMLIDMFYIITILRSLELKNNDLSKWEKLMSLESHLGKRRCLDVWNVHEKTTKILQDLNVINEKDVEDEIVHKVCGVLDVNTFELRGNDDQEALKIGSIRGLYSLAALMAHNCTSNTHLAIDDNYVMTIRACVPIKKGSPIFFNYTDVLQGTLNRKEHLREGKYFECQCSRCQDPTEFGLHLSSLKCLNCENAHVVMKNPSSPTQLTKSDCWECMDCKRSYTGEDIKKILNEIKQRLLLLDRNDHKELESFLQFATIHLNPNHSVVLDIKHLLAGLLRNILNRSTQQLKKLLIRKLEICNDFLPILEVLEPGISRLKAITLYEIHIPIVQIANKEYDSKEITSVILLERLQQSEFYLKEAVRLLLYEPCASPEGALCKRAMEELKMLKGAINEARVLADNDSEDKKNIRIKRMKNKVSENSHVQKK